MASSATQDTDQVVQWFHALSDRTRLDILGRLAGGECCVCELTDALDAAQSRLSFHLRTLKDAGLVTDRREGRWVYYTLNRDALADIEELIGGLKTQTTRSAPRCC